MQVWKDVLTYEDLHLDVGQEEESEDDEQA